LYDRAVQELGELVTEKTQTEVAFNTFVKIGALQGVDQLDFTLQLYIKTGVKIEIGPCFGWTQQQWQEDSDLGFWLRLSFSQPEPEYLKGIKLLKEFITLFLLTNSTDYSSELTSV
jgi:aspartate/methionine/tyrosine aminotransferase